MNRPQYLVLIALTVLVVLTVLAVLAAGLGLFPAAKESLTKWGPVGALGQIIALFIFVTKILFSKQDGRRVSLLLGPPTEFPDLDITRILWSDEECLVRAGKRRQRVTLVPARAGGSFRIQMPNGFLESVDSQQPIELLLKDAKGNRWCVRPFFPSENMVPLFLLETEEKIIADYGDPDR
jgi:hypothetical protein